MAIEIKVPMLPESVTEAVVAVWHKKTGEMCQEGDVIAELETDKVMLEVVATSSGVLSSQLVSEGDTVTGDTILAEIDDTAAAPEKENIASSDAEASSSSVPNASQDDAVDFVNASPSVRRTIHDQNIDLTKVSPSGRGDRYLASDLTSPVDASMRRVKMSRIRAKIAERLVDAQHTAAMLTTFN